MRIVKILLYALCVIVLMIFGAQNISVWEHSEVLTLNLWLVKFQSPPIYLALLFLLLLVVGIVIGWVPSFIRQRRMKKMIKNLTAAKNRLEGELNSLRNLPITHETGAADSPAPSSRGV